MSIENDIVSYVVLWITIGFATPSSGVENLRLLGALSLPLSSARRIAYRLYAVLSLRFSTVMVSDAATSIEFAINHSSTFGASKPAGATA